MQLPKRNNLAKVGNGVIDALDIEDIRAPENYLQYNTYAPHKMLANIPYDANSCTTCHLFTMHYSRFSQFVSSFTHVVYIFINYGLKEFPLGREDFQIIRFCSEN